MAGAPTLFTVIFFTLGGTINPLPVFLTPLIKQYGWSHARECRGC
jgi:hypothetical protein